MQRAVFFSVDDLERLRGERAGESSWRTVTQELVDDFARVTGIPNREALGIGTLMNARGLMELIIINIGLQRGIISEGLFATLVIMAVITTLMASPLFERLVGTGVHQPLPDPDTDAPGELEIAR